MASLTPFTDDEIRALGEKRTLPRLLPVPLAVGGMAVLGEVYTGTNLWIITGLVAFTSCMMFCWTSTFHEAAHQTLWTSRRLSVWSGRLLGTVMFVPYTVYRQVHIRHHAYLNQPDDWELWPYSDPKCSVWFRRAFVWLDLLCGLITGAYVYGRLYFHRASPLTDQRVRRTIRNEYLGIIVFWGTAWTVTTLLGQWRGHILAILLPMWIAGMLQTGRKFTEHLGMASFDPLLGTRTVLPRRWVLRLSSFLNFDIFIHGPHHRHPRISHTTLEVKMQQYRRANADVEYPVYHRYWRAIFVMIPWMVKNPGCGVNVAAAAPKLAAAREVDDFVSDVVADGNVNAAPANAAGG